MNHILNTFLHSFAPCVKTSLNINVLSSPMIFLSPRWRGGLATRIHTKHTQFKIMNNSGSRHAPVIWYENLMKRAENCLTTKYEFHPENRITHPFPLILQSNETLFFHSILLLFKFEQEHYEFRTQFLLFNGDKCRFKCV